MLVKPSANHLAVLRPLVVGVHRRVDADKALGVVVDEGEEVGFLLGVHVQLASGAGEDDQVKIVQILSVVLKIFLGQQFGVGAEYRVPQAGFFAHVVDRDHGRGYRVMLEALGLADDQDVLEVDRPWRGARAG